MAEELAHPQTEGEPNVILEASNQETAEEDRAIREEEARVRSKYPQVPNARSALAQRRLAQAQSKKFFDSGDYNMAKATLRNNKIKKSAIAETTVTVTVSSSAPAQDDETADKPVESRAEPQSDTSEKSEIVLSVTDSNSDTAVKIRALSSTTEGEHDAMNADEAQRVVEHPPPPVLLPAAEPVLPATLRVTEALAAVSLRPCPQRRSVQWPLGHADFAAASALERECERLVAVRARPLSSLVESDALRREAAAPDLDTLCLGVTESERQRILRHRHSTISGAFSGAPLSLLGDESPGPLLRGPAPTAVPMRRVSLIQQQNRGLLNVS